MSKELRELLPAFLSRKGDEIYYRFRGDEDISELWDEYLKEAEEDKANFIRLHIADLSNLVSKSAARDNRLTMLANELKKTTRQ